MTAIKTVNLTKKYKNLIAVNQLNLEIKQGEIFSLLGVNGAGKTTLIKMLCALTKPTEGDAFIFEKSVTKDQDKIKKLIAVSPQETAVAANLTVKENLKLICGINGFSKEKTTAKITELTNLLNLNEIINKKAGKLSGGWQRRLSIALALISEPKILFLDEPTLGLDVIARHNLWNIINTLKGNTTIILTTHYMEEAETLSDRIGIMKNGNLLTVGTVNEIVKMANATKFEDAFINIVKEEEA